MLDWSNPLLKAQAIAFAPLCIGNLFMFIALLTPAWQVAEDTDAHRYMQSGLWMYCPGGVPCWYIFSDNLINYYEKVDVCRFLLIGDCRKKLIKTPYFFGWHYAVLILLLFALAFSLIATGFLILGVYRSSKVRLFTIIFILFTFLSFLFSSVGLAVFVINAEMLESRFLIGVKNTFKKEYGYSFYLAGLACMFLMFGLLAGVMVMSYIFLTKSGRSYVKEAKLKNSSPPSWRSFMGIKEPESTTKRPSSQTSSYPTIPVFQNVFEHPPRPGSNTASQSVTPLPPEYMSTTRTFFSY
ncbi:RNA binding protein, variant 1 [Loa loa]|uniref:RNA binding protein n=1 Tax=Loa loa TaxID=7209 RepID=A0A1S0TUW8_LOALO|nr:RNA binding protein [Loa loa]XP_020307519.1 RNA binding protein, variant 1 [Loa loa]EFO20259.1 RNA binding protein [Loa loa]EJD76741.1 RNA binding protein, variant 1 [Loa loa]